MRVFLSGDNPEIPYGWGIDKLNEHTFYIFRINPLGSSPGEANWYDYVPGVVCGSYDEAVKACWERAMPRPH